MPILLADIDGFHSILSLWQLEGKGSCDVDIDRSTSRLMGSWYWPISRQHDDEMPSSSRGKMRHEIHLFPTSDYWCITDVGGSVTWKLCHHEGPSWEVVAHIAHSREECSCLCVLYLIGHLWLVVSPLTCVQVCVWFDNALLTQGGMVKLTQFYKAKMIWRSKKLFCFQTCWW